MNKQPIIGITLGDINSISVEVILKSLADSRISTFFTPLVYGSTRAVGFWKKLIGMPDFQFHVIKSMDQISYGKPNLFACWEEEVEIKPGEATDTAGKYALKSLEIATQHAVAGSIQALVTGPLNKHTIHTPGNTFVGHTEYLAHASNTSDFIMMLTNQDLRVGLLTGHLPLKDVSSAIDEKKLTRKLKIMKQSLIQDFGIVKPKIAVLGLNPHAGDGGLLGTEDRDIIAPTLAKLREEGLLTYGPYPADGFFGSGEFKRFDAILAMYHDQGLIPFKYMAFSDGINYTAGLPFVRTSPDHGTAYAIAGKNEANEDSFRNALFTAYDLFRSRNEHTKWNANPLPFMSHRKERFRIDF